jgi:hypothetical protein
MSDRVGLGDIAVPDRTRQTPFAEGDPVPVLFILLLAALIYLSNTAWDLAYWQVALIAVGIMIVLRIIREAAREAGQQKAVGEAKNAAKATRHGRLEYVRNRLPEKEPIRATLLDVVEEAYALKNVVKRAESYEFAARDLEEVSAPADLQAKSEQAIEIALDLADRTSIIARASKGRARSQRTLDAIEAQDQRMIRLKDALEYSRSTMEVLILTKGEGDRNTEKLSRSLRNLSDALEESYDDGFDALEAQSSALAANVPELSPQSGTS